MIEGTVYVCQGCGEEVVRPGRVRLGTLGSYCSNHDPDGNGELFVAMRYVNSDASSDQQATPDEPGAQR